VIARQDRTQPAQRLGIDSRPEEGEIPDVAMHLTARPAFRGKLLGLDDHLRDLVQSFPLRVAELVDRVEVNEP